jgi:hypothetical protein
MDDGNPGCLPDADSQVVSSIEKIYPLTERTTSGSEADRFSLSWSVPSADDCDLKHPKLPDSASMSPNQVFLLKRWN